MFLRPCVSNLAGAGRLGTETESVCLCACVCAAWERRGVQKKH